MAAVEEATNVAPVAEKAEEAAAAGAPAVADEQQQPAAGREREDLSNEPIDESLLIRVSLASLGACP